MNDGLTAVRIPSLEDGIQGAVYRSDVLGGTRNRRVRHDRIGLRGLVDGFELQALMMDPKIRRLEVFRVAFVLVRSIAGLASCPFPEGQINRLVVRGKNVLPGECVSSTQRSVCVCMCAWNKSEPNPCRSPLQ